MTLRLLLRTATMGATLAVSLALTPTLATPAHALSCAAHPDGTPESIASGTEELASGQPFLDQYDFAVVGTVTGVRTDERAGSPTYGATEIDVRVDGVLGTGSAPEAVTLRAADPGWMAGYPFELGAAYFIPVVARSEDGTVNSTHGCDPVSVLDDPVAGAAALGALAERAGIAFAVPADGGAPTPADAADASGGSGASWFVPATSATALTAAIVAVVALQRRALRAGTVPVPAPASAVGDGDQGVEGGGGPA